MGNLVDSAQEREYWRTLVNVILNLRVPYVMELVFIVTIIFFTGKPTGKRYLERPRHRWEDNIRKDLKEIGVNTRNWIELALDGIIGKSV